MTRLFSYARPTTLDEALALLTATPDARVLCGGTDLIVALCKRKITPSLVVDVKGVPELAPGISESDGVLRIGATTVLTQVIADERVRTAFPALIQAAQVVGSIQIRNRATLAGNLVNASPAADTAPPLLVYGASVELISGAASRIVPLTEFFTGPGQTVLQPGELMSAVLLPVPAETVGSAFGRMTRRRGRRPGDGQPSAVPCRHPARRGSRSAPSGRVPSSSSMRPARSQIQVLPPMCRQTPCSD